GCSTILGNPTLLLTINLASTEISNVIPSVPPIELPLFSYINLDGIVETQEYSIESADRTVNFTELAYEGDLLPLEDRLSTSLAVRSMTLREMHASEIPNDEKSYWNAMETFLGGDGFVRIFGKPIFVDNYVAIDGFFYVASIGYELYDKPSGLLEGDAFFLGEIAHYFFVSKDWKRVKVISQAS